MQWQLRNPMPGMDLVLNSSCLIHTKCSKIALFSMEIYKDKWNYLSSYIKNNFMPFLNRCGLDKQNQDILLNSGLLQVSGKKNMYPDNESRVGETFYVMDSMEFLQSKTLSPFAFSKKMWTEHLRPKRGSPQWNSCLLETLLSIEKKKKHLSIPLKHFCLQSQH